VSPEPFRFAGAEIAPGRRRNLEIPAGRLPSGSVLHLPVEIVHGLGRGPTIWLSGAIHGDEIVGVEIIRRVLHEVDPSRLAGVLVAAPVVNVFGFVTGSRYLPDRRDLNRSFPGSRTGSLAARLARLFMDQVVARCSFGIDFHAGSDDRTNLPQVRGDLDDPDTRRLASAFGAPLMIHSRPPRGALRHAVLRARKRVLLFEGGEPRRFSPGAVAVGAAGTLRVLQALDMIEDAPAAPDRPPLESRATYWVRAPRGGIVRLDVELGDRVGPGTRIGSIWDPTGRDETPVPSRRGGVVLGRTVNPLVNRGDAVVHLAEV
jgi:hypothetical protein